MLAIDKVRGGALQLFKIVIALVVLIAVAGCVRPPANSDDNHSSSAAHPKEYYEGYWICCGYETDGMYVAYDDLSTDERLRFPHIVLYVSDGDYAEINQYVGGEIQSNYLVGEPFATPDGIAIDGASGDDGYLAEFVADGDNLTLQQDDTLFYLEKRDYGSQLYTNRIEFGEISLEVPADIAYMYSGLEQMDKDSVQAYSYRRFGPSISMFSMPVEARDTIEYAGEYYAEHEDEFTEFHGIIYCIMLDEDENGCISSVRFVANGRYYEIWFESHSEDSVDYTDYAANFYTKIEINGGDSGADAGLSATMTLSPQPEPDPDRPEPISWSEASQHVGETVTICGPVAGSTYASDENGQPTFIDLGVPYPDPDRVKLVIWGENRGAFPESPEMMYTGETICVTGEIYIYDGVCNIEVSSPSQIEVM